jgi:hypothetical protein
VAHRVDHAVQHLVPVLLGNGTHLSCVCLNHADACRQARRALVRLQRCSCCADCCSCDRLACAAAYITLC